MVCSVLEKTSRLLSVGQSYFQSTPQLLRRSENMIRSIGSGLRQLSSIHHRNVALSSSVFRAPASYFSSEVEAAASAVPDQTVDAEVIKQAEEALKQSEQNIHLDQLGRTYATGRRKTSVARVWVSRGTGLCVVNGKSFLEYFQPAQRGFAIEPFNASKTSCLYDVMCTVEGGGISGRLIIMTLPTFIQMLADSNACSALLLQAKPEPSVWALPEH